MIRLHDEAPSTLRSGPGELPPEVVTENSRVLQMDVFSATEYPEFTEQFFRRQHACYQRFRSEAAATPHQTRTSWKGVYLVGAADYATGELAGGVGVYERMPDSPLPVELAIGATSAVGAALDRWSTERVVEMSGLWVEERWRRSGLSKTLMLVAMSAGRFLQATKAVGFSHQHVLDFYMTIGLEPDKTVQESYDYPNQNYVSTFIWGDLKGLSTAPRAARRQIEKYSRLLSQSRPLFWSGSPVRRDAEQDK